VISVETRVPSRSIGGSHNSLRGRPLAGCGEAQIGFREPSHGSHTAIRQDPDTRSPAPERLPVGERAELLALLRRALHALPHPSLG